MPNYHRVRIPGGCYFFTLSLQDRRTAVLTHEAVRAALRAAVVGTRACYPFHIDAWVLLPDHLHTIWTLPDGDADYSARWAIIKRRVSQAIDLPSLKMPSPSHTRRRESGLWQRRFWEHAIRDERDYQRHFDYIHWNPVKHGYVEFAAAWPWSTFHRAVREGIYPASWGESIRDDGTAFGEP